MAVRIFLMLLLDNICVDFFVLKSISFLELSASCTVLLTGCLHVHNANTFFVGFFFRPRVARLQLLPFKQHSLLIRVAICVKVVSHGTFEATI